MRNSLTKLNTLALLITLAITHAMYLLPATTTLATIPYILHPTYTPPKPIQGGMTHTLNHPGTKPSNQLTAQPHTHTETQ
jgi:hypothetical protein